MAANYHLISASIAIKGCKPRATVFASCKLSRLMKCKAIIDLLQTLQGFAPVSSNPDELVEIFNHTFLTLHEMLVNKDGSLD